MRKAITYQNIWLISSHILELKYRELNKKSTNEKTKTYLQSND
ncbi:MAG: hypothetical protein OJF59_002589 [Cytophagales bacterium]|nr:MAG: hypothetical protein OJF59_002589 [Cytophagales bacterium]